MRQKGPRFEALLSESGRFKPSESAILFGRTFLKSIVRDAWDDEKLKEYGQPVDVRPPPLHQAPTAEPVARVGREVADRDQDSPFMAASITGLEVWFVLPWIKVSFSTFIRFSRWLPTPVFCIRVGGRVRNFASFWPSLIADVWVLERCFRESENSLYRQTFSEPSGGSCMPLGSEMKAICDRGNVAFVEKGY